MRVLHVIPSISPHRGGPSEALRGMTAALRSRGMEVDVATTDDGLTAEGALAAGVHVFPRNLSRVRALREFCHAGTFPTWLARRLPDYDLLHVHALFSHLPTCAMRLARRAGVPYISRPLGLLGRWPLEQSRWRKRLYLGLIEKRNLRHASAIHFTSEDERSEARAVVVHPWGVVIPHGVTVADAIPDARARLRRQLGLDPGHKIVLHLGRLHEKKGLHLLIPALARLRDRSVVLVLAGQGDDAYRALLNRQIRKYDLAVRDVGFATGMQKQMLLQGADVFALASHHENFGVAVVEALAAGARVVVSDQVPFAKEIHRHGLGKVTSLQVAAITAALRTELGAPADPAAARAFVQDHYTWSATASSLLDLYDSILLQPRLAPAPFISHPLVLRPAGRSHP